MAIANTIRKWAGLALIAWTAQTAAAQTAPSTTDAKASPITQNLYQQLWKQWRNGKTMFGHQDALAYGVNWKYEWGRSDTKDITGQYPAVYGWELGHLEIGAAQNLDSVPFSFMRKAIQKGFADGAVITLSWHPNHPVTGKSAWDTTGGAIKAILPNGTKHATLLQYLDRVAEFIRSLQTEDGKTAIPVLFRPWHELTGSWFWWGRKQSNPEDFKALWQFTYQYLTEKHQLHQILWVYNVAEYPDAATYKERYPGNQWVDIISFDSYQHTEPGSPGPADFIRKTTDKLRIQAEIAREWNKLPAIAEIGYDGIPQADWWTTVLSPLLKAYPVSYALVWRNAGKMANGKMHYFAPYPGHPSAANFKEFAKDKNILMGKALADQHLYAPANNKRKSLKP